MRVSTREGSFESLRRLRAFTACCRALECSLCSDKEAEMFKCVLAIFASSAGRNFWNSKALHIYCRPSCVWPNCMYKHPRLLQESASNLNCCGEACKCSARVRAWLSRARAFSICLTLTL